VRLHTLKPCLAPSYALDKRSVTFSEAQLRPRMNVHYPFSKIRLRVGIANAITRHVPSRNPFLTELSNMFTHRSAHHPSTTPPARFPTLVKSQRNA